jgi:hypothetical protein
VIAPNTEISLDDMMDTGVSKRIVASSQSFTLLDFSIADFSLVRRFIIDITIGPLPLQPSSKRSGRQTKISIMSSKIISIALIISLFASAFAFAPNNKPIIHTARKTTALSAFVLPPVEVTVASIPHPALVNSQGASALQDGLSNYLSSPAIESSTLSLSLKDRPPPPTAEELAEKKANFNFWFWGGGFVAPFIATVYYFGPQFWKY